MRTNWDIIGIIVGVVCFLFGVFCILVAIVDVYSDDFERFSGVVMGIIFILIGGFIIARAIISIKKKTNTK